MQMGRVTTQQLWRSKGMQIYNDSAGVGLTINTTGTSTGLVNVIIILQKTFCV
jgi:hypothetical protein